MPDYIPTRDADFRAWLTNFQTYLAANAVALGITALEATLLGTQAGDLGAEVWMKVCPKGAAAPADPAEMSFVGVQTRTRFTVELTPADAGKAAFYRMRWVNSRGEKGPWSEAVCATIAA